MNIRRLLLFGLLVNTFIVSAQKNNLTIYVGAGNSFTGLKSKEFSKNTADYSDIVKADNNLNFAPLIGLNYDININHIFSVQLGVQYNKRNIHFTRTVDYGSINTGLYDVYTTNHRLHYLNFPATFNVTILQKGKHKLKVGTGMLYGFLINGKSELVEKEHKNGTLKKEPTSYNLRFKKALVQGENTSAETFNVFDAGIRVQTSYMYNKKWYTQLNFDYSLYDVYLLRTPSWNPVKTRQLALLLGYQLF